MKRLFSIVIFLLGVAMITTSCEKEDIEPEVVPVVVNPPNDTIDYDTVRYDFVLGAMTPDSTVKNVNGHSYYVSNTSYNILLSEHIPNYATISGDISIIEFNENQGDFYSITYDKVGSDINVNILTDYGTFQSNTHSIEGRVFTDSTIYEITFNFELAEDPTYKVIKHIMDANHNSSISLENSTGKAWAPAAFLNFDASSSKDVFDYIFWNNEPVFDGTTPANVDIASFNVYSETTLHVSIHNDDLRIIHFDGTSMEYHIESVVGDKIYLNDGSNLYWIKY